MKRAYFITDGHLVGRINVDKLKHLHKLLFNNGTDQRNKPVAD